MGMKDPRVDAYIAKSADFAKPILERLRAAVHSACPDVTEEMKWSTPHFTYKGMFCGMAAFRKHCIFGFWKHKLVLGPDARDGAWGQFGRITSLDDLPSAAVMARYLKKAKRLNDDGVAVARKRKAAPKPVRVPADLAAGLKKNKKAQVAFADFSPSHKREYVEWITEAKRAGTRAQRLTQSIAWIAEGKSRNWKYERR
jgi:bacteriocin resistance YdeI/OmpD-like protein/uncharacterized protein DUF1801